MRKALITGVTGQDGSYLAEFLLEKGYEVHGIKRRASMFNTQRIDHRDWGHAKNYVRMQWMMLQQEKAEDFVIATGLQISVRDFVRMAAKQAGIEIVFSGKGVEEVGTAISVDKAKAPAVAEGDVIVRVDPRYFRPAEVETLLGDPGYAKERLGWEPRITVEEMCAEMVEADLEQAKQNLLLDEHGYKFQVAKE